MEADTLRVPGGGPSIPLEEIEVQTSRSSGPGGQHANTSDTRVVASFDARSSRALSPAERERIVERTGGVVRATAQDARGQARNRQLALERLAEAIGRALARPRRRRPTKPGRAARERRLAAKRRRSEVKRMRRRPPDA